MSDISKDWFNEFLEDPEFTENLSKLGEFEYYDDELEKPIIFKYWTDTRWKIAEVKGLRYILSPAFWDDGELEARFALFCEPEFNLKVYVKKEFLEGIIGRIGCYKVAVDYSKKLELIRMEAIKLSPKDELLATIQNLDHFFTETKPVFMSFDYNIAHQALTMIIAKGLGTSELLEQRCKEIKEILNELIRDSEFTRTINPQIYIQVKALLDFSPDLWLPDFIKKFNLSFYLQKMYEIEDDEVKEKLVRIRREFDFLQDENELKKVLAVIDDFHNPKDWGRKYLVKLSKNVKGSKILARALSKSFEKVPTYFRNELIRNIYGNRMTVQHLPAVLIKNFNFLSQYEQDLLYSILKEPTTKKHLRRSGDTAIAIAKNYYELPMGIRNILFEIYRDNQSLEKIDREISRNYKELPKEDTMVYVQDDPTKNLAYVIDRNFKPPFTDSQELYLQDPKHYETIKNAEKILDSFDLLPKAIKNEILINLSKQDHMGIFVGYLFGNGFHNLPKDYRYPLLKQLSENKVNRWHVAWIILYYYFHLSDKIKKMLPNLLNDDEVILRAADAAINNFFKLPSEIKNIIIKKILRHEKLMEEKLIYRFDLWYKWPNKSNRDHILPLLVALSKYEKGKKYVGRCFEVNFTAFSEEVRQKILDTFYDKEIINVHVAYIIFRNFNSFSPHIEKLIYELLKDDGVIINGAGGIVNYYDKLNLNLKLYLMSRLSHDKTLFHRFFSRITHYYQYNIAKLYEVLGFFLDNKDLMEDTGMYILKRFHEYPPAISGNLLKKMLEKDNLLENIIINLFNYYENLPMVVWEFLFILLESDVNLFKSTLKSVDIYTDPPIKRKKYENIVNKKLGKYASNRYERHRELLDEIINNITTIERHGFPLYNFLYNFPEDIKSKMLGILSKNKKFEKLLGMLLRE